MERIARHTDLGHCVGMFLPRGKERGIAGIYMLRGGNRVVLKRPSDALVMWDGGILCAGICFM